MPTPILDLAGWRFGRLMVLNPAPAIGLRMRWVCACDCGQTTEVASGDLRKGPTKTGSFCDRPLHFGGKLAALIFLPQ